MLEQDVLDCLKPYVHERMLDEVYGRCTRIDTMEFIDKLSSTYAHYIYPPQLRKAVVREL